MDRAELVKRILVTGSRDWLFPGFINVQLDYAWADLGGDPETSTVSGACPTGADAMCEAWAEAHGIAVERHPAEWDKHPGRSAGFVRNAEMVRLGADLCLAFIKDESPGATMTANLAERAGIETRRFEG
jgi:hypothetical protein